MPERSSHPGDTPLDLPVVVIVGRPNVGKSALFNRILSRRQAIVHEESGVTRDRVAAAADWYGRKFLCVDTGGLNLFRGEKSNADFDDEIRQQLEAAVTDASRIVFVVDVQAGLTPLDSEVANWLRSLGVPVTVAVNKADNDELRNHAVEFAQLGFEHLLPISCTHRRGVGDLLDQVTAAFPVQTAEQPEKPINITVVGRPNVGKSSTINRLLGAERVIVSEVAGTTRDAIDIPLRVELGGRTIALNLIDTAGIRRKGKASSAVEIFSLARAHAAIKRADIVIMLIDAQEPGTAQDKKIARLILDERKACLLLANKWDLASQEIKQRQLIADVHDRMPFLDHAPLLTCCAVSGYNFRDILPAVIALHDRLSTRIPTPLLNRVIQDTVARMPPPNTSSGTLKIYYAVYNSSQAPTFILFVNDVERCRENYLAYLRARFREAFSLDGLPVYVELRQRRRELPEVRKARRKRRAS